MRKLMGCALALALVGGVVAGCGGDDDEALSKSEYLRQADAICAKADRQGEREAEERFSGLGENEEPSAEQLTAFVEETVVPNIEGQLEDLRELPAPDGDEDRVAEVYDAAEEGLETVEDDPQVILTQEDPFAEATRLAKDYGFEDCGE